MLLDQLRQQYRATILAIAANHGATNVRVLGSVARREDGPDSDVDFLVELPRDYDMFGQRLPLTERLQTLLQR